jgi:hypothetical protein
VAERDPELPLFVRRIAARVDVGHRSVTLEINGAGDGYVMTPQAARAFARALERCADSASRVVLDAASEERKD